MKIWNGKFSLKKTQKKEVSFLNKLKIHSEQSGRAETQQVWSNTERSWKGRGFDLMTPL